MCKFLNDPCSAECILIHEKHFLFLYNVWNKSQWLIKLLHKGTKFLSCYCVSAENCIIRNLPQWQHFYNNLVPIYSNTQCMRYPRKTWPKTFAFFFFFFFLSDMDCFKRRASYVETTSINIWCKMEIATSDICYTHSCLQIFQEKTHSEWN